MSDTIPTPRTDAFVDEFDSGRLPYQVLDFARQLERDLAAVTAELERINSERCEDCNAQLTACGPQAVDGIPTMDCKECQLRKQLATVTAQRDKLMAVLDAARTFFTEGGSGNDVCRAIDAYDAAKRDGGKP